MPDLSQTDRSASVELAVGDGDSELVVGPFLNGLVMNDCAIWEPGQDEDHAVALWSYGEDHPGGWEVQEDPANLWPLVQIRGAHG